MEHSRNFEPPDRLDIDKATSERRPSSWFPFSYAAGTGHGGIRACTGIRNTLPVRIVAALLPAALLIPLYPGAPSHDIAKRHRHRTSQSTRGVMFNSSPSTMLPQEASLSHFPYKLFRGLAFKSPPPTSMPHPLLLSAPRHAKGMRRNDLAKKNLRTFLQSVYRPP